MLKVLKKRIPYIEKFVFTKITDPSIDEELKKNEIKKYNGTIYANVKSDFEEDIKDYKYLGLVK